MNSGSFLVCASDPSTNQLLALVSLPLVSSSPWEESLLRVTLEGVYTNHLKRFFLDLDPRSSNLHPAPSVS